MLDDEGFEDLDEDDDEMHAFFEQQDLGDDGDLMLI
jgi:hypothetical protein